MHQPKRSTQLFLISLCVTLVTLGTVLVLLLAVWLPLTREQEDEQPAAQPLTATEEESLSLLMIASPTVSDPPAFLALFSYAPAKKQFDTVLFSPYLLCTSLDRTDTLAGHYSYGGILGLRRAIAELTGHEPDRYLRTDQEGFSALLDAGGGISCTISSAFTIGEEQFYPGEQQLSGRKLSALLFQTGSDALPDLKAQTEWTSRILPTCIQAVKHSYESFSSLIFSECETTLTRYDLLLRQSYFTGGTFTVNEPIAVDGTHHPEIMAVYPDESALSAAKAVLSPAS